MKTNTLCRILLLLLCGGWLAPVSIDAQSGGDVVLYAAESPVKSGRWAAVPDATAAGGSRLTNADAREPKGKVARSSPKDYFEITFYAEAKRPYRLWVRGKAESNSPYNDSVFVQFSNSVDQDGDEIYRLDSQSAATVNLEDCLSCGLSGWGWQDNGWGAKLGQLIYFAETGAQIIRVQTREDGLSIDQIVLSPQTYLENSPGQLKNDRTILSGNGGIPLPENKPPTVEITASPKTGDAPLPIAFHTDAADGDGSIVSYHWDFGDGESSTETSPQHLYRSPGKFNVRLVVTDDRGATAGASASIKVKDRAGVRTLRVMTWNIHKGVGTDGKSSLDKIAAWIDTLDADLVALCEVMRRPDGEEDEDDQLQYLAESLKQKTGGRWYHHWFAKHPGDKEGNGILSRLPFVANDGKYLSHQRSVARVTIRVGANDVHFFATHLDHDTPSQRLTQAIELTNWLSGFNGVNIIGGDFNASAKSAEIGRVLEFHRDSWQEAKANGAAKSYPDNPSGRTRRSRIDYLFYGRNTPGLTLKGAQLPDTRDLAKKNVRLKLGTADDKGVRPSDHNAVVVDYEIK